MIDSIRDKYLHFEGDVRGNESLTLIKDDTL